MHSCIYHGTVTHHRTGPVTHHFQYGLFMLYLDLDELPAVVGPRRLIAGRRWAGHSFLRSDHLYSHDRPLADEVRELVAQRTGLRCSGPIRLLTQLRTCGYYFSPLNLYYLFAAAGEDIEAVVAEVNNTPWGERHCYVLWEGNRDFASPMEASPLRFSHAKEFHVSPFYDLDLSYDWKLKRPAEDLQVAITSRRESEVLFHAGLALRRRPLTRRALRWMGVRHPLLPAQISAAIYWQALQLWWKRCPFYPHPSRRVPVSANESLTPERASALPTRSPRAPTAMTAGMCSTGSAAPSTPDWPGSR